MRTIVLLALIGCRTGDKVEEEEIIDSGGVIEETPDADADGYDADEDCDDNNSVVNPGAAEICDGVDNNCDGTIDEGVTSTFYEDADGDGFGDPDSTIEACETPDGYVATGTDCDDATSESYPGAAEQCDDEDNDCDGEIDEDVRYEWYADADGDGYGDPDSSLDTCDPPTGFVTDSSDCDDTEDAAYPGAEEVCDEVDNDCDGSTDENVTTTYYQDTDGDGFGIAETTTEACDLPTGYAADAGDCDDSNGAISPNAVEVCDDVDNDCDSAIDNDPVDAVTFYADADGDGFGDASSTITDCSAPAGYGTDATDCDDGDAAVNPDAVEICDEVDNDCDGDIDTDATDMSTYYADADGDGYGSSSSTTACDQPTGYAGNSDDCDDADASANPGETEVCDEIDNDCDGSTDEGLTSTWYIDYDGDGDGSDTYTADACEAPSGYVSNSDDCDDTDATRSTSATEVCDGIDNDCDGSTDDNDSNLDTTTASTFYADDDGDGFGDADSTDTSCEAGSGYVEDSTDCDDTDSAVNPDAAEQCNGDDLDCDGIGPEVCSSCLETLDEGGSVGDGLYTIELASLGEIEVYCDMTTDGGGWTLLQRTVWDWSESEVLVTDYSDWYDTTVGEPTTGEVYRMAGEGWGDLNEDLDHLIVITARDSSDSSDCDPLYYIGTGGALTVGSSSTTLSGVSADVTLFNSTSLATTDTGSSSCVSGYDAVPWFYSSCCTTCPTFHGSYWTDEAHPMASYLDTTEDHYGNLDADVCSSGAAKPNDNSSSYEGANIMEYYIR